MFKQVNIEKGPIHGGKIISFENGLTAVVGPNGCGKSLLVEYMSFAVFGSVALRGKVDDYKDLSITVWLSVKGKDYKIERTTKNCKLYDSQGTLLCTGTKPCNIKIISLLGYDYNVYKMGNYAAQLDILGLGNMKPSERKTALDKTLGIGIIDKLIKYTNDKALEFSHEEKAIRGLLIDPGEEPVAPEGYRPILQIAQDYENVKTDLRGYKIFQAMEEPVEPENPDNKYSETIRNVEASEISNTITLRKEYETKLLQFADAVKPKYTRPELEEMIKQNKAYQEYQQYLAKTDFFSRQEKPIFTQEELDEEKRKKDVWDIYHLELTKFNIGKQTCPKCGHIFSSQMAEPTPPPFEEPKLSFDGLQRQQQLINYQNEFNKIPKVEECVKPILQSVETSNLLCDWDMYDQKEKEEAEISAKMADLPNYTLEDLQVRLNYERDRAEYGPRKENYEGYKETYEKMAAEYANFQLTDLETKLNKLAILYHQCQEYETQKKIWDVQKSDYDRAKERADTFAREGGRYKKAAENLKEMKVKIKGYVLPSLQKVSSHLLSDMSDGLFNEITISPDFDILVEGREINLFSGSEQAMINLALRLGLGQVLTHKVFSVFIGDEIDASMREDRAQLTANCLKKISKYINQVILVSHRDIEADHYVQLGNGD